MLSTEHKMLLLYSCTHKALTVGVKGLTFDKAKFGVRYKAGEI